MSFKPVQRVAVWRQIADQITDAILSGELTPGEPLPTERELGDRFGASRASIREALRALEAQGLLIPDDGNPTQPRLVTTNAPTGHFRESIAQLLRLCRVSMPDLVEFRCVLEGAAVERAAERRDAALIADAERALEECLLHEGNVDTFEAADIRFHVALSRASGNEVMLLVMQALRETVTRRLFDALKVMPDPTAAMHTLNAEHEQIFGAIKAGKGTEARDLMLSHINSFYNRFTEEPESVDGAATVGS